MNGSDLPLLPADGPFRILRPLKFKPAAVRSLVTAEGLGDRLRFVAFAELQAREAFFWAAERFKDSASTELRDAWRRIGSDEDRHMRWLLERMAELGVDPAEREVPSNLWESLVRQDTARSFAIAMGNAEERGRVAGEKFHRELLTRDPKTAELFRQIASEEAEHVALVANFFPDSLAGDR